MEKERSNQLESIQKLNAQIQDQIDENLSLQEKHLNQIQ